jgi:hypothetical protein
VSGTLGKRREGIITSAKDVVVEAAKSDLDVTAAGIEATKDGAVTAGTAVTETVSSLATKARKLIRSSKRASSKRAASRVRKLAMKRK